MILVISVAVMRMPGVRCRFQGRTFGYRRCGGNDRGPEIGHDDQKTENSVQRARHRESLPPTSEMDQARSLDRCAVNAHGQSPSTITSPRVTPMRNSIRSSCGSGACSASSCCHSIAQRAASPTFANSTSNPSPAVLTTRPWCSAILGSVSCARNALRRANHMHQKPYRAC